MHRELGKKSGGPLSRTVRVRRPGDAPPFGMTKLEGQRPKEGPIGPRPSRIVFPTSSFVWPSGIRSSDFPQIYCRSGPIGRGVPLRTGRLKVRILPAAPFRSVNRSRNRAAVLTRTRLQRRVVQVHGAPPSVPLPGRLIAGQRPLKTLVMVRFHPRQPIRFPKPQPFIP